MGWKYTWNWLLRQRVAQVLDQVQAVLRMFLHLAGEIAEAVAPAVLGDIHRLVGILEQVSASSASFG